MRSDRSWQEKSHADAGLIDGHNDAKPPSPKSAPDGPPKATIARRAQSYSDFHWAIQATFGPEHKAPRKRRSQVLIRDTIKSETDFLNWYQEAEERVLNGGDDEYM